MNRSNSRCCHRIGGEWPVRRKKLSAKDRVSALILAPDLHGWAGCVDPVVSFFSPPLKKYVPETVLLEMSAY
jgi:hypothetical protein